jgi:hypothetical protein
MVNGSKKGAAAEADIVKLLNNWSGLEFVRKGRGSSGSDLRVPKGFKWSVEVKHHKQLKPRHFFFESALLRDFWFQTQKQAREDNRWPLLLVKADGKWFVVESMAYAKITKDISLMTVIGRDNVLVSPLHCFFAKETPLA